MRRLVLAAALLTAFPLGPAAAQGTGRIFVSNERSHEVIVLSPD